MTPEEAQAQRLRWAKEFLIDAVRRESDSCGCAATALDHFAEWMRLEARRIAEEIVEQCLASFKFPPLEVNPGEWATVPTTQLKIRPE